MNVVSRRDWFGLAAFDPGDVFRQGQLHLLEKVDSTSDFLRGRGRQAAGRICSWDAWGWQAGPLRVLAPVRKAQAGQMAAAKLQTRGRGRQGRRWFAGGLQLSWTIQTSRQALASGFAVWAGFIVATVLHEHFKLAVGLKWPNDLLVSGRKLGGLLLDTIGGGAQPLVVIGLGLNLTLEQVCLPPALRGRITSISAETGRSLRPAAVAGPVLARLSQQQSRFQQEGWTPFAERFAQLDCLQGRQVQLVAGGSRVRGRVVGIDADGALLLRSERGKITRILAGDVHLHEITDQEGGDVAGASG